MTLFGLLVGVTLWGTQATQAAQAPSVPTTALAVLPFTGQAPRGGYGFVLARAIQDGLAQVRTITLLSPKRILAGANALGVSLDGELTEDQRLALGRALHVRGIVGGTYEVAEDAVVVRAWFADLSGHGEVIRNEVITTPTDTYLAAPQRILTDTLRRLDRRVTALEGQRIRQLFGEEPTSPEQYARYAQAVWAQGTGTDEDHARALALIVQAVEADPNFALGHLALAQILGNVSRWKATVEARAALAVNPELPDASRTLGDLLMAAPERPFDKAIDAYRAAVASAPDDLQARVGLANARLGKGDPDGAIREYRSALEFDPRSAQIHFGLGKLYNDEKGWYEKAVAELQQAAALDPDLLDAWVTLGEVYEEKGLHEQAIERYRHVLSVQSDHSGATYDLALAYEQVDAHKAIETWKRYIQLAESTHSEEEWVGIAHKHLDKLERREKPAAR
jgi:tetratricopeptide (TPR) repeat protein